MAKKQPTIVKSVDEAIANMRAAADKHLDNQPESARQEWAERTARTYIARGIIVVEEPECPCGQPDCHWNVAAK